MSVLPFSSRRSSEERCVQQRRRRRTVASSSAAPVAHGDHLRVQAAQQAERTACRPACLPARPPCLVEVPLLLLPPLFLSAYVPRGLACCLAATHKVLKTVGTVRVRARTTACPMPSMEWREQSSGGGVRGGARWRACPCSQEALGSGARAQDTSWALRRPAACRSKNRRCRFPATDTAAAPRFEGRHGTAEQQGPCIAHFFTRRAESPASTPSWWQQPSVSCRPHAPNSPQGGRTLCPARPGGR